MRGIDELLDEYGKSHQHPTNKLIHWFCVPLIVWALLGLVSVIDTPAIFTILPIQLNWAAVLIVVSMFYYLLVSKALAAGIFLLFLLMLLSLSAITQSGITLWKLSLTVFVLAWIGQFIGHSIEGKKPSFFKDLQFLLIGPLWLLSFVYKKLGISY